VKPEEKEASTYTPELGQGCFFLSLESFLSSYLPILGSEWKKGD
jgi:hypothetical protein